MARVVVPPFGLTPQQAEWYESLVPDVPEEAVAHLVHEYRVPDQHHGDLLQEAYIGTKVGVETFDPVRAAEGAENSDPIASGALRTWVFFKALHAAQAVLRRESRYNKRLVGRVWDGVIEVCTHTHYVPRIMSNRAQDRAALTEVRSRIAAGPAVAVGVMEIPAGDGDQEVHTRATAKRVAAVLDRALGGLSERRHQASAPALRRRTVRQGRGEDAGRARVPRRARRVPQGLGISGCAARGGGSSRRPTALPTGGAGKDPARERRRRTRS